MCILLHTREIYQWAGDQDLLVYKWGYSSLLDLCYIIDDLYKNFTKSVNFCLLLLKERWTASTRSGSAFASVFKNWIDDFDDSYIFFFRDDRAMKIGLTFDYKRFIKMSRLKGNWLTSSAPCFLLCFNIYVLYPGYFHFDVFLTSVTINPLGRFC